jgi:hypothetical protein
MLQVFHGRQGPSKPRERKADRDKGQAVRPWRKQKRCPDILGKGGEGRARRHEHTPEGLAITCASRLFPLTGTGTLLVSGKRDIRQKWGRQKQSSDAIIK